MLVKNYIVKILEEQGTQHVFGVSGANIEDLFEAVNKSIKISVTLAKNEYNAGMMAIGSYLSSKSVQVVLTTSGAGVLNTIPILAEGFSSKLPFVLISGTVAQSIEGIGAFQDTSGAGESFDLNKMLIPCTYHVFNIKEVDDIPEALENAFLYAIKFRRPVAILIPKNIYNLEISFHLLRKIILDQCKDDLLPEWPHNFDEAYGFITRILNNKKQSPLVILGEDLIHLKDLRNIQLFAKNLNAKIALTPAAKGLYDHFDFDFLGLTGVMGHDEVNIHLKKCHDVIIIGSRMDMLSRYSHESDFENKRVLHFNNEVQQTFLRSLEDVEIIGNVERNILKIYQDFGFNNDFSAPEIMCNENQSTHNSFDYFHILKLIEKELEADADIFVDAGNSGAHVIHNLKVRGEGLFYVSLGMGGMGNSIGSSIGCAISSKKKTYTFLGDGSFLMHGFEIHTAIQQSLPIVFFIFNNNSHGMCATRESVFLEGEDGLNKFTNSFFGAGMDRIFPEIQSFEVNNMDDLYLALLKTKHPLAPCIISINIDNHTKPPFKTFNKK